MNGTTEAKSEHESVNKPKCVIGVLSGPDGNVFAMMSKVDRCLRMNAQRDKAVLMAQRVLAAESYEQAKAIMAEYVEMV